jgi:amidase
MAVIKLNPEEQIYKIDKNNAPAVYIDPGDTVICSSLDAYSGLLDSEDKYASEIPELSQLIDSSKLNPVQGPIYVNGAEVGDTVKITIEDIEVADEWGSMCIDEGETWIFNHRLPGYHTERIHMSDGCAELGEYRVPLKPMLGVVAVTPEEPVLPMWQGKWGGNMDCTLASKGNILYLPVLVPGALVVAGDAHALQGEGEIICGIEVPARSTLKIELIKGKAEKWPMVETPDRFYSVVPMSPMEEATKECVNHMLDFVLARSDAHTLHEWMVLMNHCGDIEVCEISSRIPTMRFGFDKAVMGGITF